MIEARVICDSISPAGQRLTTFQLRYPKFIHGEFMTHRVISRNAGSSRAIPTVRLIAEVRDDALRAAPVFWGRNQPGMQAAEELSNVLDGTDLDGCNKKECASIDYEFEEYSPRKRAQEFWRMAARSAANNAEHLLTLGAHKQIVNRLLEPFSHISVVATATEWDNFFGLRLHHMAQPEMRALATAMWRAYGESVPELRRPGAWHLPFSGDLDDVEALEIHRMARGDRDHIRDLCIKVSVARCARVSYDSLVTPGRRSTIEEDLVTYAKLNLPGTEHHDPLQPIHASPAEHQATPDDALLTFAEGASAYSAGINRSVGFNRPEQHGNFIGWRQYRKMLPGEAVAPLPKEYQP